MSKGDAAGDAKYLKNIMDGMPVAAGCLLRVRSLGYASHEFIVEETTPGGVVRITKDSIIRVKSAGTVKKTAASRTRTSAVLNGRFSASVR